MDIEQKIVFTDQFFDVFDRVHFFGVEEPTPMSEQQKIIDDYVKTVKDQFSQIPMTDENTEIQIMFNIPYVYGVQSDQKIQRILH